jgi:peptidoglycan/LPS O-acetylase OafA/YrhL
MAQSNPWARLLSVAGVGGAPSWSAGASGADAGSTAHLEYRPDIDGLRAVAVLPVVFYHLNISLVSGGFVGVDVFFVISGYLITSLISAEMFDGTYSIMKFYVRRARRIFPALFVMCAVTALFVFLFCLPTDVRKFAGSLAATTLFASNFYFNVSADYFAAAADTQPLLHTWSLAVEEQFYIFFPLILLFVRRNFARREKQIMIALLLLSLAISIWLVQTDGGSAFYLPHSRAWELLLGALLAIGAVPAVRSHALAGVLGILGLALIGGSVLLYKDTTPFPGLSALVPCVGAALIIHAGRDGSLPASRVLSMGPVRFIGLISYSLYLWHWPIDVLSRYVAFWHGWDPDLRPHKLAVLALSFACAILSWHFVEKPFRRRPYRFGSMSMLSSSAAAIAALVALAVAIQPLSLRFWDLSTDEQKVLATLELRSSGSRRNCFLSPSKTDDFKLFDQVNCLAFSDSKPNWLLIGDSQAADLWIGISTVNPEINLLQATATGCRPYPITTGEKRCTDLMHFLYTDFIPKHRFDTILVSARWSPGNIDNIKKTIAALKPHAGRVVIVGPHVEYKHDLPWLLVAGMLKGDAAVAERSRIMKQRQTDRMFAERLRGYAGYVSLYRAICPDDRCRVTSRDGVPLAFDYGHLSPNGSLFVAQEFRKSGAL